MHRWYQEAYVPLPRLVLLLFQQLRVQSQARPVVRKGLSPWFARRARSFAILNVTSWSRKKIRMTYLIPEIGVHADNSKSYSRISICSKTGIMAVRNYYLLMSTQSRSHSSNQLAMLQLLQSKKTNRKTWYHRPIARISLCLLLQEGTS